MKIRQVYAYCQILSLDVALGALFSGMMVADLLSIPMPPIWYLLLPVSVWVIYTADHLLDAYRLQQSAHTARHLFHHRYFSRIFPIWLFGILFCIAAGLFWVPLPILWFGLGMGGWVLIHLGLVQLIGSRISRFLHKELGVGTIYAAGVWGGAMVLTAVPLSWEIWLCALQFLGLALVNLLVFSIYEYQTDELDGHTSFVRAIGPEQARKWVAGFGALGIAMVVLQVGVVNEGAMFVVQLIYLSMLGILLWINASPKRFGPNERYRLIGDGVFLLPVISIWL